MVKNPFDDEPLQPFSAVSHYGLNYEPAFQQQKAPLAPVPQESVFGDPSKEKSQGFWRDLWSNFSRISHNRSRQYTPEELERFRKEVEPPDFQRKHTVGEQLENIGDVSAAGLQSLSYPLYKATNELPSPLRMAARTLYGDMPLWAGSLPSMITSSAGRMIHPVELAMKSDEDEGVVAAREKLLEKNQGLPWKPDDPANFVGLGTLPTKNFSLGTFGGKQFAERLWAVGIKKPLETLKLAEAMEKQGNSPAEIWMETAKINMAENNNYIGWEKTKGGDWALEAHDQASFKKDGPEVAPLTETYRNPPVEKAIDLGDITLRREPTEARYGEYNSDFINPEIGVGTRVYHTKTQNPNIFGKDWSPRSIASHEVQHFIQDIEKWQNGSNSDAILKGTYGPEINARLKARQLELFNEAMASDPVLKFTPDEHRMAMLEAARKDAAFELYESVAGEVQARNVQKRLDMTPEERLAKRPELTEDVPRDRQILDPAEQRVKAKADLDRAHGFTLFPITEKVRAIVKREGQPMFSKHRDKTAMQEAMEKAKGKEEDESRLAKGLKALMGESHEEPFRVETQRSYSPDEAAFQESRPQLPPPKQPSNIDEIVARNTLESAPPSEPPKPPSVSGTPPGPPKDKARIVPSQEKSDPPTFDKLYTAAKDDLHPIRRMEEKLLEGRRGTLAEPDKSPYILSRLTRGLEGRVQQAIRHNMYRFKDQKNVGPGLEKILKPIKMKDRADFEQYLVYKRTLELNSRGIETGFDIRNAADFVRKNAARFDATAKQFTRFAQQGLEYLRDSGMISKDAFARMTEANKDYAPLYRLMEEGGDLTSIPNTLRNPIKEIKGSERDVISPIESVVRNTYAYIGIAERNRALNAMKDLADANPAVGKTLMQRVVTKAQKEADSKMGHNGGPLLDDAAVFKPDVFHPAADEIVLFRDGERQTYKVAPEVAEAVKNLNREELNWIVKAAALPAKWLRAGATLAPEFIARNPIRDQFSASILSNNNYIPLVSLIEGFVHTIMGGRSKQYQAALKGGGFNANLVSMDRKYINDNLMRLQDPTVMGKIKGVVTSPVEALRKMSELMENATRMGEFLQARRGGKSIFASSYDMREVALDFARVGAKGRAMNAITAFWNANLEGTDRLARAMWENPKRTSIKALAGIALPSALLWLATRDDERMKEVPKWERDAFWVIPMDDWQPIKTEDAEKIPKAYKRQIDGQWFQNKGEIIKIPKPFTEGIILGSGTERALEAMYGNDPKAWKHFGKSIKDAVIPGLIPTGALPILETSFGRSWFLDRDIVPKYLQRVDPKEQYNPYTSETAKFFGRQIAKADKATFDSDTSLGSPLVLEHIYRGYTGGLGRLALEGVEKGLEKTGLVQEKNWPTNKNADIPLLRAFASRHPSSSAESIQQFYDEYEKRDRAKNTAKLLDTRGETDEARKVRDERATANAESTHKQIGAMNKEVRRVYDDKKLSPEDKREKIDLLYLKMINLAQKANEMYRATEKAPKATNPFETKPENPFNLPPIQ